MLTPGSSSVPPRSWRSWCGSYGLLAKTQWFLDVAGAEYRAAMAALSPEQIEEAKQAVLLSDMRTEALAVLAEVEAGTAP